MIKPGHIRIGIDREIYFEYHKDIIIEKSENMVICRDNLEKMYEASKQRVKISNAKMCENTDETCVVFLDVNLDLPDCFVKDNQPCIAEVENNITIITKIS